MLSEAGVPVNYVCLPEDGGEILRSTSDGSHCEGLLILIIRVIKVVLALTEVDDLHLIVRQKEEIGRFDVTVADALALQEGASGDETAVHRN